MITVEAFLEKVREIQREVPQYKLGGFGLRGVCDCIGLIIGALRRIGAGWGKVHGSNYALRNEMEYVVPIKTAADLRVGWPVYKFHPPGHPKNRLPSSYRNHPDQNDYYHVGVVDNVSPLRILHCTSWKGGSGIKVDTRLGSWAVGGPLKRLGGRVPASPQAHNATPPVLTQPAAQASRTLRVIKGVPLMRGEDVRNIQKLLIQLGYSVGIKGADGVYGWDSHAAVVAFQRANGMPEDGIVTPATRQAMSKAQGGVIYPSQLRYLVTLPDLTKPQADALLANYPNAQVTPMPVA